MLNDVGCHRICPAVRVGCGVNRTVDAAPPARPATCAWAVADTVECEGTKDMRKNSARRFAARGRALVVLSVIAMVMLAGCAQGEAADATSDADGADVASEPADGAPEPADEPDVIALCDSFGEFGDDIDTAAVDDWAAQAEGTTLAEPGPGARRGRAPGRCRRPRPVQRRGGQREPRGHDAVRAAGMGRSRGVGTTSMRARGGATGLAGGATPRPSGSAPRSRTHDRRVRGAAPRRLARRRRPVIMSATERNDSCRRSASSGASRRAFPWRWFCRVAGCGADCRA